MKNKQLISTKIEKVSQLLTNLEQSLTRGTDIHQIRQQFEKLRDTLEEMQTLVNTESDSWN